MAGKTLKALSLNSRGYAVRRTYGLGYAPTVGMTVKPSPLNSRGYADRRTYGNRTAVNGMHAECVPQQREWATPSGSMSVGMHLVSVGSTNPSVGSANPRLLKGDPVRVEPSVGIRLVTVGSTNPSVGSANPRLLKGDPVRVEPSVGMASVSVGSTNPRLLRGDRVAVILDNLRRKTFVFRSRRNNAQPLPSLPRRNNAQPLPSLPRGGAGVGSVSLMLTEHY